MASIKIMNVLLSEDPQFLSSNALLCRSTMPWRRAEGEDAWLLKGAGTHDFTTFFNALSVQKWKKYTSAKYYSLHLEIKGSSCRVKQTRADSFSYYAEPIEGTDVAIPASSEWHSCDLKLMVGERDVITSFLIECDGDILLRNSYYSAEVSDDAVRPVELSLCTTTFKKEEFITKNIELVRKEILDSADDIAGHFHMHVVDNGRTLDAEALTEGAITVYPNENVGGAGGFARGMIQAMEQDPRATHVLLMDDDVLVSTESIKRTYNLLRIVNDEYADAFVSGAMMNMDEPYVRWEEMGFVGFDGAFHPIKPTARMDVLHDVVDNETFDIPEYLPDCGDQAQHYAAWWYCVIPMTQIDNHGLPLPIFVRGDDVEYSRRCKPKFITMNGICIWHLSFHLRYNAAQERYQMTRNCLIDQYASDFAPLSDFNKQIEKAFREELCKFNYTNAELILKGIEDFLKGPEWIMQPVAQQAFMDANKESEKLVPLEELNEELNKLGVDPNLSDWQIWRDEPVSALERAQLKLSYNGQSMLGGFTQAGRVSVIDNVGWAFPKGKVKRAAVIVSVDIPNRKAVIRRKDSARFKMLKDRYNADIKQLQANRDQMKERYQRAFPIMTSVEFWKGYLGL